tara:strand:+ start:249 stop:500 length:252 start_codon:yes stop_codon:yes gene_type:complete
MIITKRQLRKIIKEEKARLNEQADHMFARAAYRSEHLQRAIDSISEATSALWDIWTEAKQNQKPEVIRAAEDLEKQIKALKDY